MFEKHLQKNDILSKDAGQASNFIKKGIQHRCFPARFVKFLRIFSQNSSGGCFCCQNRSKGTKRYSEKRCSTNSFVETQWHKETEVIIKSNESVFMIMKYYNSAVMKNQVGKT